MQALISNDMLLCDDTGSAPSCFSNVLISQATETLDSYRAFCSTKRRLVGSENDRSDVDCLDDNGYVIPNNRPVYFVESKELNESSVALQKWDGYVVDVNGDSVAVRLINKTNAGYDEHATLLIDDFMSEDKALVAPGAQFYWSVGYRKSPSGQRSKYSLIRFRRLPQWSESDVQEVNDVESLKKELDW